MGKINTIHDKFIKALLGDKSMAADYFQNYLPAFVSEQLDFSTLIQLSDTYLSRHLQKTMSDIVYSCQKKDKEGEVKVSLLIEHKSYLDVYTPVQIGSYIFSGLQKQIDNGEKLSIIIPILFYHGAKKWEYQTLSDIFKNQVPEWKQYIPDFHYIYNNLNEISDKEVEALNNKFLVASLLTLKHSFQKDWLEINAHRVLMLTEGGPRNLQENLIIYLFGNNRLIENKIVKILETLPVTIKDTVMSTLDFFIEKGIDQTLHKATCNMLLKGFPVDTICEVLEVTPEYVAKISAELNNNK